MSFTLPSQTLADIIKLVHVHLHFTKRRQEFFLRNLQLPCFSAEAYLKIFKHLRWSVFACPVNDIKSLIVYAKKLILDSWRGSEYACVQIAPNNILCHHDKNLRWDISIPTWLQDNFPSFE